MKVKSLSHVRLLSDPMDCSLPGSSVHGIVQARVLEWGAIANGDLYNFKQLFGFLKNIAAKAVILIHKTESIWRRKVAFYIQS